jgi:hypothetical protein
MEVTAMVKPPCKSKCERRTPSCHAECKDYGEYAAALKAQKAAIKADKRSRIDWTQGKEPAEKRKRMSRWGR